MSRLWLPDGPDVDVRDVASVTLVRERARAVAEQVGLPDTMREHLKIVASELATNQMRHARMGGIAVRAVARDGVPGVEVVAADRGDGFADPAAAWTGIGLVPQGLGGGLAAARRLADETDVDQRAGEGLCVRARFYQHPPLHRVESGCVGRAAPREPISGDDALVVDQGGNVSALVADGLGHGAPAREAARRALEAARTMPSDDLRDQLATCDERLRGTRGAAVSIARFDPTSGGFEHAGVGNVQLRIYAGDDAHTLQGHAGTLGNPHQRHRFHIDRLALSSDVVIVLASDGVSRRLDLREDRGLRKQHPFLIALHVLSSYGQSNDDATVLVLRCQPRRQTPPPV
jgi:anti-sigma regulatory factor (Ser/Thr protein kinase)